MSLYHVAFDSTSREQRDLKKTYKPIIFERNNNQRILFEEFENNQISKEEFLKQYKAQNSLSIDKINDYNKKKKSLANAHSFNGRKSFHYWLFVFGLSFSFFFIALRYAYRIIVDAKHSYLKKSLIWEAAAWMSVSLFWVLHSVFVKKADLPSIIYVLVMLGISILISVSTFFAMKYVVYRNVHLVNRLKAGIVQLVTLVSDIRINHYFVFAAKAYSKENKELIDKDVEIVEEKIFSTIEKVADET